MSNQLVTKMKEKGVINPQDEEIYIYGLEIIKLKLIAGLIALIIGFFLNTIIFWCCFLLFIIPIRKYAGGVHSSSKVLCMLITELIMLLAELIYKYIELNDYFIVGATLVGIIMIFIKSPYYSENHPLTSVQIKKYRKKSIFISIGFSILLLLSYILQYKLIKYSISIAFCAEAFLLIIPTKSMIYQKANLK